MADRPAGLASLVLTNAEPASAFDERAEGNVRRIDIDGIPVFWLPEGRRPMVALQFRVGRSDEAFPMMGITHVVEHLALYRLGRRPYDVNGFVDNVRTVFHASGSGENIIEFVREIVRALTDLPLERLNDESRVLKSEAARRSASLWEQLAWYRFGAVGHGETGLPEFGLGTLSQEAVAAWSRACFTRGNAAISIAGPIPDGLRIDLAQGPRRPIPAAVPIPDLLLPAWAGSRIPGIAMGVVVPRTSATAMGNRILTKRLEDHLRYELGRSYEVSVAYQPFDATEGHASIFASCLDEDAASVRTAFLKTVEQFISDGPTDVEISDDIDGFTRHIEDPDAGYGELDRAASNELTGHPPDTFAMLLGEMRATSGSEIKKAMSAAIDQAIMIGPLDDLPAATSTRSWSAYPNWSANAVDGRSFDPISRKYPWSPRAEQLIVGAEGISWLNQLGQAVTVRFRDCVGLVVDPDGTRTVYGGDGFRVRFKAADWRHGDQALASVMASVPADRVVRLTPT